MNNALNFSDYMPGALILAFSQFGLVGVDQFGVGKTERRNAEHTGGTLAQLAKFIIIACHQGMLHAGIANDDGFTRHGRKLNREGMEIDFHDVPGPGEQRGNLIQQPHAHAHKFIFGGAAEFGKIHPLSGVERWQVATRVPFGRNAEAGVGESEREKLPHGQGGGDFKRGRTAHARTHGNGSVNCGIKSAEMDTAFAKLVEHTFDVVRPGRGGVFLQFIQPKYFRLRKGRRNKFDLAVVAGLDGQIDIFIDGKRKDKAVVIISVIAKEFQPARGADDGWTGEWPKWRLNSV